MPMFRVTEERTLTQTRTVLVNAPDEDAIWACCYEVETMLSDWSTVSDGQGVNDVESAY